LQLFLQERFKALEFTERAIKDFVAFLLVTALRVSLLGANVSRFSVEQLVVVTM
jgi:hypothetical protein